MFKWVFGGFVVTPCCAKTAEETIALFIMYL